jgi:imidazolonepropionase-like amidohydrolase
VPPGAEVFDVAGRTVIPGLVGMHEHLFYEMSRKGVWLAQEPFAALYLASGVTTIRTGGTTNFAEDLRVKRRIDAGAIPGPKVHPTSPYLAAAGASPDPEHVRRDVARWAEEGATSFKAYTTLRRDELRAAIEAAHERGLKVTGHLCAVGFREAARLGIDNLEHGLFVDTEFNSGKQPDECPASGATVRAVADLDVEGPLVRRTISELVSHGVAVTSTLAIAETYTSRAGAKDSRTIGVLAPGHQADYLSEGAAFTDPLWTNTTVWGVALRKEMQFERLFVAAGGRLLAGADPTGWGGLVAGFGDQRQLELLVEAGFTPEQAIQIFTSNGAAFLGERDHIGTIAPGKQADLVVLRGDLSANIANIRKVELVFKDGVPYRSDALIASVQGTVGQFAIGPIMRSRWTMAAGAVLALLVARRWPRRSIRC